MEYKEIHKFFGYSSSSFLQLKAHINY